MHRSLLMMLLPLAVHASPPELGYAQASNAFKRESRPTQYQPIHLVDGKEATAWCSASGDPLVERLTFGFKGEVTVDALRIVTGNAADEETWKGFGRVKKLSVKGLGGGATVTLADERAAQLVALKSPVVGTEFTVEVLDLFPADDLDQPTCLSEVVFYSGGKPLGASWLGPQWKYDPALAPLLGTWYGGSPGAPTHFLSLYADGTWRYAYEPWGAPRDAKSLSGSYEVTGTSVALRLDEGAKVTLRAEQKKGTGPALAVDGPAPEAFKRPWRGQP
jgi:hypothetical protein